MAAGERTLKPNPRSDNPSRKPIGEEGKNSIPYPTRVSDAGAIN